MKTKLSTLLLMSLGFTSLMAQTVKDIDGNVYKTVKIGTQTWMIDGSMIRHQTIPHYLKNTHPMSTRLSGQ